MEIRFSESFVGSPALKPIALTRQVAKAICSSDTFKDVTLYSLTSAKGRAVRFVVHGDEARHDRVIRALLTLDPDATIRTARAVYEGLADFEKQRGK